MSFLKLFDIGLNYTDSKSNYFRSGETYGFSHRGTKHTKEETKKNNISEIEMQEK